MKINKNRFYCFLLFILLSIHVYTNSYKITFFIFLLTFLTILIREHIIINKNLIKIISPLIILSIIGGIGTIINKYNLIDISKDIIFISKPILSIVLAYTLASLINNKKLFINTIIYSGLFFATTHLLIVLYFYITIGDINASRGIVADNFIEVFALYFLISYKNIFNNLFFKNKLKLVISYLLLILSSILYFSRMMFIICFIIILSYYGFLLLTKKNIRIGFILMIIITSCFYFLQQSNIDKNKNNKIETFLYKVKISPKEVLTINNYNITNHGKLWERWRSYEVLRSIDLMNESKSAIYIGTGYGSLVNLRIFAPIGNGKKGLKYISHLHNGYAFILYKTGIIGIIFYFIFLGKVYFLGNNINDKFSLIFSSIAIIYLFTTLTITGAYNHSDNIIILLGSSLFFFYKK